MLIHARNLILQPIMKHSSLCSAIVVHFRFTTRQIGTVGGSMSSLLPLSAYSRQSLGQILSHTINISCYNYQDVSIFEELLVKVDDVEAEFSYLSMFSVATLLLIVVVDEELSLCHWHNRELLRSDSLLLQWQFNGLEFFTLL